MMTCKIFKPNDVNVLIEFMILLCNVCDAFLQYVKSKNCIMEFRYALTTLRIPVVVCVVGTGYAWERSEVGDSGSLSGRHRLCLGEIRGM